MGDYAQKQGRLLLPEGWFGASYNSRLVNGIHRVGGRVNGTGCRGSTLRLG